MTPCPSPYVMPAALARRLAELAPKRPYLLWPGASTPLGTLGYVSAGLELVHAMETEPHDVVVALGSGGTAVGMALGMAMGGWRRARVVAVRAADAVVTNRLVLRGLEAGTAGLLAMGGWVPTRPGRIRIDGRWLGAGYGHPTPLGARAMAEAANYGLELEPTYTAKAFAAALSRLRSGRRIVFVQTFAGSRGDQPG